MITREMIRSGIKAKLIEFVIDPNMEHGTVCRIGDSWFYFGGQTAEEMNPEEFTANVPVDDIADEVFQVLEEFRNDSDGEFIDEYNYYDAVLTYRNDL